MAEEIVHENSNLRKMESNAAKFASIINNNSKEQKFGKSGKNKFNKIAGINLDQNRFSELVNLEERFWDLNSNANSNAKEGASANANANVNVSGEVKNTKSSKTSSKTFKNASNLGSNYFLKTSTAAKPKPTFKSNFKSIKSIKNVKKGVGIYLPYQTTRSA